MLASEYDVQWIFICISFTNDIKLLGGTVKRESIMDEINQILDADF